MAKKDYYQILGVKKDANADEIKKAYRRLARKYHPDVNPNDKTSEDKFKEVQEAYDILSDEKKRKVFDKFGYYADNLDVNSPFGGRCFAVAAASIFRALIGKMCKLASGSAVAQVSAIFSAIFSAGEVRPKLNPNRLAPYPKKGGDIEIPLALSFEESVNGYQTNLSVNRSEQCSRCQGAGDTGGAVVTCTTCKGAGQLQRVGGSLEFSKPCGDCRRNRQTQNAVFAM